jgi:hypothetical protein
MGHFTELRQSSISDHDAPVGLTRKRFVWGTFEEDSKSVPHSPTKSIRDTRNVVRTYPLRIGVLRFQVNEQLLRVPIKQRRKVCDPGAHQCYQAMNRVWGGNDKSLIKTLKEDAHGNAPAVILNVTKAYSCRRCGYRRVSPANLFGVNKLGVRTRNIASSNMGTVQIDQR